MKRIPESVLNLLANKYGASHPAHFAGGYEWSDGTLFTYSSAEGKRVLKIMSFPGQEQSGPAMVAERMRYLRYLGENGVPIVFPVKSSEGNLHETCFAEQQSYVAYAWDFVEGEHIKSTDIHSLGSFYRNWGKTLGMIHRLAREYPIWEHSECSDAEGTPLISWQTEWEGFHNWLQDDDVKKNWRSIRVELQQLHQDRHNFGFIHNDPHSGNLLLTPHKAVLIDFDVANYHWFMVDITIAILSEIFRMFMGRHHDMRIPNNQRAVVVPFLEGYRTENDLSSGDWANRDLFFTYRKTILFTVFYNQVKEKDPVYLGKMKQDIIDRKPVLDPTIE